MTGVAYNSPLLLGVTPRPPVQVHAKPAINPSLGGHCSWVHYKIVHIARSGWIALIVMIHQPAWVVMRRNAVWRPTATGSSSRTHQSGAVLTAVKTMPPPAEAFGQS